MLNFQRISVQNHINRYEIYFSILDWVNNKRLFTTENGPASLCPSLMLTLPKMYTMKALHTHTHTHTHTYIMDSIVYNFFLF